ncbi:copper resistance CopC family protein [Leifsonia sp. LS-T14]|uniref:copper resistance CopC family protein n=1 Tax=unclassified Leifsonia TaxID=2663824 RepID=UPI0035A671D3
MTNRLLAAAAGVAAAVVLALAPVASADAHDYLVGSDPSADSTVTTALDSVTLTFNDRVLDLSGNGSTNLLTVTGPDSATRHFETGCATIADTKLSAPVALGAAGRYTVTYQIVSADGHTVSSSYAFTYQPPAGTAAAAGSKGTPCGATASPGATSTASPTGSAPAAGAPATATASTPQPTAAASSGTDLGLVIGIAIAIVLLAVIGVVIVLLTARRKPPTAADVPEPEEPPAG